MKTTSNFRRLFRYGGIAVVIAFLFIQFIPINRTNPPIKREPIWDAHVTRELAGRACFDCHSNETKWPWYAYIAPVSWMIAHDVQEGREEFNFSEWGKNLEDEPKELAEEFEETIRNGSMPPWNYVLVNPEERGLTSEEKEILINGLRATVQETSLLPPDYSLLDTWAQNTGKRHHKHFQEKHREYHR